MLDRMNQPSGARAKNIAGHVGNKHCNYPHPKHAENCKLITLFTPNPFREFTLRGLSANIFCQKELKDTVHSHVNKNKPAITPETHASL